MRACRSMVLAQTALLHLRVVYRLACDTVAKVIEQTASLFVMLTHHHQLSFPPHKLSVCSAGGKAHEKPVRCYRLHHCVSVWTTFFKPPHPCTLHFPFTLLHYTYPLPLPMPLPLSTSPHLSLHIPPPPPPAPQPLAERQRQSNEAQQLWRCR